jgi:hypothetical protein
MMNATVKGRKKAWLLVAGGALLFAGGLVFGIGGLTGEGAGIMLVGAVFAFVSWSKN